MNFKHVTPKKVSDFIFDQLKEAIVLKEILPKEQLPPERELCQIFNTSRQTVREAIQKLKEEQLIEQIRGAKGGTFVLPLTAKIHEDNRRNILNEWLDFKELFEYRNIIETQIIRLATMKITEEQIQALYEINQDISGSCEREDFRANDVKFHIELAKTTRNVYFENAVRRIRTKINPGLDLLPFDDDVRKKSYEAHHHLIDCMKHQKVDLAEKAMFEHIGHTETILKAILHEEQPSDE